MIRLMPAAVLCAALTAMWSLQLAAQSAPQAGTSAAGSTPKQPVRERSAAAGGSAVVRDEGASSRLFRELDRNGDGYLSPDELKSDAALRSNWIAIDRNRDGRISRPEFEAVGPR